MSRHYRMLAENVWLRDGEGSDLFVIDNVEHGLACGLER